MRIIATIAVLQLLFLPWLLCSFIRTRREIHSLMARERHFRTTEEKLAKLFTQDVFSLAITTLANPKYRDVNAGYEKMTGYMRDEVLGRALEEIPLWIDRKEPSKFLARLDQNGHVNHTDFEYRRKDGETRSAEVWAELVTLADEPCILALAIDVTERKRAVQALQEREDSLLHAIEEARTAQFEFSSRMISAQEEERARLARELHDDINQRLALLANGIERLEMELGEYETTSEHKQLRALSQLTNEIVSDIQNLSHQLHPAKLRFLGLGAAVRALCKEFSRQHTDIEVEYTGIDLPKDLDEDISLSIFRTIQECLRNIAKHSHAHSMKVAITCTATHLSLEVSDDGVGFDPEQSVGKGLGLTSIQERLRQVGGAVTISSASGAVTHINATVPIHLKPSMQVAGATHTKDAHP